MIFHSPIIRLFFKKSKLIALQFYLVDVEGTKNKKVREDKNFIGLASNLLFGVIHLFTYIY